MSKSESKVPSRQDLLEALSRYQRQGTRGVNVEEMGRMMADESDRGVVVILTSFIEDILLLQLRKKFAPLTDPQIKNLTRAGGLLANFDDRINLAQALGMLKQEHVESLQIFKAMRNACAHSRRDITFLTPELRQVMALLIEGDGADDIRSDLENPMVLRAVFISAFIYLTEIIMGSGQKKAQATAQGYVNDMLAAVHAEAEKLKASREKRKKRRASNPQSDPKG